jgi:hypothetical protein
MMNNIGGFFMPRTNKSTPLSLIEKEHINALSASGKTPHAISKEIKRSPHTVKRYIQCPQAQEKIEVIKQELSDLFEELARRMIDSITDMDITKINAYQRTIASGIATDKMRLLREDSTQDFSFTALLQEATAYNKARFGRKKQLSDTKPLEIEGGKEEVK